MMRSVLREEYSTENEVERDGMKVRREFKTPFSVVWAWGEDNSDSVSNSGIGKSKIDMRHFDLNWTTVGNSIKAWRKGRYQILEWWCHF